MVPLQVLILQTAAPLDVGGLEKHQLYATTGIKRCGFLTDQEVSMDIIWTKRGMEWG